MSHHCQKTPLFNTMVRSKFHLEHHCNGSPTSIMWVFKRHHQTIAGPISPQKPTNSTTAHLVFLSQILHLLPMGSPELIAYGFAFSVPIIGFLAVHLCALTTCSQHRPLPVHLSAQTLWTHTQTSHHLCYLSPFTPSKSTGFGTHNSLPLSIFQFI